MTKASVTYIYDSPDADAVLRHSEGKFKEVITIGYDHNGRLLVYSQDGVKNKDVLWILESVKTDLMKVD